MKLKLEGQALSVNKLYRGRRFLTDEGVAFKEDYGWQASSQYHGEPLKGLLEVWITFTFHDNKRKHDSDSCLKATFDSMTGILWEDDSQIDEFHVKRAWTKNLKDAGTLIEIKQING